MDPIYLANNRDTLRVVTSLGYDLWSHFSMSFIICDVHKLCLGLLSVLDT